MRLWGRTVLATLLVAVLPVAMVWALWSAGLITTAWLTTPLALALTLAASYAGGVYWQRRPGTGDVLFSDLLLWGWLRRVRAERERADAVALLDRTRAADEGEKVRLLKRLAAALDAKDPYLDGHSNRVARHCSRMSGRLGVPDEEAEGIRTAAAIHDVGKLHVPPELLSKPERLTMAETAVVQRHAEEGAAMVACLGDPAIASIVRHHHERFDGGGYPAGLSGEAIPLGARIVAVADTFDAITSARPYRPARAHKVALDVLTTEAGTQLDPVVVRAFVSGYSRRRGLALWTLLAIPFAKARQRPLPAAVVLGGVVIAGVAATVLHIAGTAERITRPAAAQAAQLDGARAALPGAATHHRARTKPASHGRRSSRIGRAAAASAATVKPARTTFASAHTTRPARTSAPHRTARNAPATAPAPSSGVAPERRATTPAPSSGVAPQRRATTPRPVRPRHPSPPPVTATPPPRATSPPPVATTPPPVTSHPPAAAPPPVVTPAPVTAPPPAAADGCKKGAYAGAGYRNQGQCISAQHGHH